MVPGVERRLVKGEQTRQRLLQYALDEVLEKGPDRVGFTSIARRAELTTGALYARYENSDDLLVDVWHTLCEPTVSRMVKLLLDPECRENRDGSLAELAGIVQESPARLHAAVSLLMAARRNEALKDDIEPSFKTIVDKAAAENPVIPVLFAIHAGIVLHGRASSASVDDWTPVLRIMFDLADEMAMMSGREPASQVLPIAKNPQIASPPEDPDDIDFKLFRAVVHVVNRAGVDRATVARIARRANVNPAIIYTRYADKDDLIFQCVKIGAVDSLIRNQKLFEMYSTPMNPGELFARVLQASAHEEIAAERIFRLESVFAAGHHERLRELMSGDRDRYAQMYASVTGVPDVWNYPSIWPFVVLNRAILHGQALMLAYGYMDAADPCIPLIAERITATMSQAYQVQFGNWDTSTGLPEDRD